MGNTSFGFTPGSARAVANYEDEESEFRARFAAEQAKQREGGFGITTAKPVEQEKSQSIGDWFSGTFGANGNLRGSGIGRVMQGMADPVVGGVQVVANALGFGDSVNRRITEKSREYENARANAGSTGFDGLRAVGNIASPANLALASKIPVAASALGRVAAGAGQGAVSSLLNPIEDGGDNYWADKAKASAYGAAAGGVLTPVVSGIGRVISPNASVNKNLALLRENGIHPTVGQTLGGVANSLEEKAMSVPILGDAIKNVRQQADSQFRKAAFSRALDPIDERISTTGRDAIAEAGAKLGKSYDEILPKMAVDVTDPAFVQRIANLRDGVKNLPEDLRNHFDGLITREIDGRIAPNGILSGQNLKDAWNAFRDQGKKLSKSPDAFQSNLGDAIKQAFQELKGHVTATNPADLVQRLKNTDLGYANFKRLQAAASGLGAESGNFTPAQLLSAVRSADGSKDKAAFASGNALLQDMAEAGKGILSSKYPDSGTAGRGLLAALLGGGAYASGMAIPTAAGIAAGTVAYTPAVQNKLATLIASRPGFAPAVAQTLRELTPYATGGIAQATTRGNSGKARATANSETEEFEFRARLEAEQDRQRNAGGLMQR